MDCRTWSRAQFPAMARGQLELALAVSGCCKSGLSQRDLPCSANFGHLESPNNPRAFLEPSWRHLGRYKACLGHDLGLFGPVLGLFGPVLGHLGPILGLFDPVWGLSWLILVTFSASLVPFRPLLPKNPKMTPKITKKGSR